MVAFNQSGMSRSDVDLIAKEINALRDALREIANRAGAPTMHYSPEIERKEQRESLNWIAARAAASLTEN